MQCYSFIKTMMILFNFLIFVSMVAVGSLGLPTAVGHNLNRVQAWDLRDSCAQTLSCMFPLMMGYRSLPKC